MEKIDFLFLILICVLAFGIWVVWAEGNNRENKPCEYFQNYNLENVPLRCLK